MLADELSRWLQVAVQHAVAQSAVEFKWAHNLSIARKVFATLKLERQDAAEAAAKVSSCDHAPPDTAVKSRCTGRLAGQHACQLWSLCLLCACLPSVFTLFTASKAGPPQLQPAGQPQVLSCDAVAAHCNPCGCCERAPACFCFCSTS